MVDDAPPLFSVLMPTHNRPDSLAYAIQSVLAQTEQSFELLVVGDGAAPETEAVVKSFSDPRIRWFDFPKAPHFGYANRNLALRSSRGELIAFAADDDLMMPDHLALMRGQFVDPSVALVYGQVLWVSTDGICGPDLTNLFFPEERRQFMARGNTIAASGVVYRASALAERTVWPEDVNGAGDWEIWRRIVLTKGFAAVRYLRLPTCLHFSAKWKNLRDSGFARLTGFIKACETSIWFPAPLRVAIPTGHLEQKVFWDIMCVDPDGWTALIREAAADAVNRLALDRLENLATPDSPPTPPPPPAAPDDGRAEALAVEVQALAIERDAMRMEMEALKRSKSWRWTAPLRQLRRHIGR
ncbi:glycosyltransferase [Mesorhizobium sp. M0802]|uniref:glycosyltransferase family 2 protein n=2 Tax=unclassified Mesorhizobium TaxID=325217 RepID=UPI003339665C